jgi:regulator of cell morphogenesis and NO signaling
MAGFRNFNFNELEADEITGFIIKKHHVYVTGMLELLHESCEKAREIDAHIAPQLAPVCQLLKSFSEKVLQHIQNEEEILFPYIQKLLELKRSKQQIKFLNINLSETTLRMFNNEHAEILCSWDDIKRVTDNFIPFKGASPITSLFFAELLDFEMDLQKHFDLEEKVLFPKLKELELEINQITNVALRRIPGE